MRNHKPLVYSITYSFSVTYLKKVPFASALYFLHILPRHREVNKIVINGGMQVRLRWSDPQNQLCNCTHAWSPRRGILWESRGDSNAAFQGWKEPQRCQGASGCVIEGAVRQGASGPYCKPLAESATAEVAGAFLGDT